MRPVAREKGEKKLSSGMSSVPKCVCAHACMHVHAYAHMCVCAYVCLCKHSDRCWKSGVVTVMRQEYSGNIN